MDKALKISLAVIILLLVTLLLYNIFGSNKGLNESISNLKQSIGRIDTALTTINATKLKLDSVQTRIDSFRQYTRQVDEKVAKVDADRQQSLSDFNRNNSILGSKLDVLRQNLQKLDSKIPSIIPVDTLK